MSSSMISNRGSTLWLTGLPGAGKSSIANSLKKRLDLENLRCFIIDGDVLRSGLCSDLTFSPEDRTENIRRIKHLSILLAQQEIIVIIAAIGPLKKFREDARQLHKDYSIPFFEIYINTPLEECIRRDPKGMYQKALAGQINDFTGISAPYEEPENPDLTICTVSADETIISCSNHIYNLLKQKGVIADHFEISLIECVKSCQSPASQKQNEENSDRVVEQSSSFQKNKADDIKTLDISDVDASWLQVIAEGWAAPLRGFMNEDQLLQVLYFKRIKDENTWFPLSIPIVLPIKMEDENMLRSCKSIILTWKKSKVAVLEKLEVYKFRFSEIMSRIFGCNSPKHPTAERWIEDGYVDQDSVILIGGEVKEYIRIRFEDGLDSLRLTPLELREEIKRRNVSCTFAFQLRNPIHNGHALLMKEARKFLQSKAHLKSLLLLHPLGGWTKCDDVPLAVRIRQHEAVLRSKILSGEDDDEFNDVLLAIFPSPMYYAGPVEVLWHCRARVIAGANYYIVGRDPAGVKHPDDQSLDLYDPTHGARILDVCPELSSLAKIIPFQVAAYHKDEKQMKLYDPSQHEKFIFISGSLMRKLAKNHEKPPEGFMIAEAWNILAQHYASA